MVTFDLRKAEGEIISCKRVKNSGSCEEHLSKCVWARWNPSWGKCWHRTWEPLRLTFVQKYGGKNASQARRDVPVACQPLFRHSCCSKQAHNQHRRRLARQWSPSWGDLRLRALQRLTWDAGCLREMISWIARFCVAALISSVETWCSVRQWGTWAGLPLCLTEMAHGAKRLGLCSIISDPLWESV